MVKRKKTNFSSTNKKASLSTCHAGFSCLTVPIFIGDNFLGTVFVDGFMVFANEEQQRKNIDKTIFLLDGEKEQKNNDTTIPVLSGSDIDFVTKLMQAVIEEMIEVHKELNEAEKDIKELKRELNSRDRFSNIIGKSQNMLEVYNLIEKVASSKATVLITGANGTGKELVAEAIHAQSKSSKKRLITVNCGAFNDNLLESELFGHVKGAFTGAISDKKGVFEEASDSSIFLDEIADTSVAMQVRLLRVLQNKTFMPVGSNTQIVSSARVICATNKDLAKEVEEGRFREDLYYRINVINIKVPSLKDRLGDIPALVEHFLSKYAYEQKQKIKKSLKSALKLLWNILGLEMLDNWKMKLKNFVFLVVLVKA